MGIKVLEEQLKQAREAVCGEVFGTDAWEAKMVVVRELVRRIDAARPQEKFCSLDSGVHRTRLLDGRII